MGSTAGRSTAEAARDEATDLTDPPTPDRPDNPNLLSRQAQRRSWGQGGSRLLPLLVFVVLAGASLGAFGAVGRVVDAQEDRMLAERADEVKALLTNTFTGIESSLRVLGPLGASSDPAAAALFAQTAGPLVQGNTKTVGVAAREGGGFAVVATTGDGPAVGASLAGGRAALAARALALSDPQPVSDLITDCLLYTSPRPR